MLADMLQLTPSGRLQRWAFYIEITRSIREGQRHHYISCEINAMLHVICRLSTNTSDRGNMILILIIYSLLLIPAKFITTILRKSINII